MRAARIVADGLSYYHSMSRIIEGQYLLNDEEKERLRILLRQTAAFSGVHVLTHSFLETHFHLVLEVPEGEPVSEEDTYQRMRAFYKPAFVTGYAAQVRKARERGEAEWAEMLLDRYRCRMHDISEFMKTFLQRFTQSYNKRHNRRGTLWEGRFKSNLVEGKGDALAMACAYVDLNAVRAGLVDDPKDYRFCGYGEAAAGSPVAVAGQRTIMALLGDYTLEGGSYRKFLFMQGMTHRKGGTERETFRQHAQHVIDSGGKLSPSEVVHCRVRYFSAGLVLGSRIFVQDTVAAHRNQIGVRRRTGPRPIRSAALPALFTLRDLRPGAITVSC
jgi:putative transposase